MAVLAHALARRSMLALLPVLLVFAALQAQPARANAYSAVEGFYARTGTVPACRFSARELQNALSQAPTYDLEYFGDFINAVQTARQARAGGECNRPTRTTSAASVGPLPPEPRLPASVGSPSGASVPWPFLLAIVMLLAGGLGAAGLALARGRGWDPAWAQSARHAWREAEFRATGAAADLRDRFGP